MEIIKVSAYEQIDPQSPCIACIGYFDGLHKGHQTLIDQVLLLAKEKKCVPACICFDEDPWHILHQNMTLHHLTPHHKRLSMLGEKGVERCYVLHFDEEMRQLSKQEFIEQIILHLNLDTLVCGQDFHFGYQGKGNVKDLMNRDFHFNCIDLSMDGKQKISSSTIEQHIINGRIERANELLGYDYTIEGTVIQGKQLGAKALGFPTANLGVQEAYVIPRKGVYVGTVTVLHKTYKAMINIGHNPTMNFSRDVSIEAYLLDFNGDIYDEKVTFSFVSLIRSEQKFASTEALISQLQKDVVYTKTYKGV